MTATYLTIIAFCLMIAWGTRNCFRLLAAESSRAAKDFKVDEIPADQGIMMWTAIASWLALFFFPSLWPGTLFVTLLGSVMIGCLARKKNRLAKELIEMHQEESVLSINLGRAHDNPTGPPLKIWFKRGKASWPPVELEFGVSHFSFSADVVGDKDIGGQFLPRIRQALEEDEIESLLSKIKSDLLASGVTHPIDINGWDAHPIVRDFIERIMDAEVHDAPDPESPEASEAIAA